LNDHYRETIESGFPQQKEDVYLHYHKNNITSIVRTFGQLTVSIIITYCILTH